MTHDSWHTHVLGLTTLHLLMDVLFCDGHCSMLWLAHADQGVAFERIALFRADDVQ